MNKILPKYPVYIVSKGRHDCSLTANCLKEDGVSFKIVIEPQEEQLYLQNFQKSELLILPFSNLDQGSIPARNYIWEDAIKQKSERHWCLDDNISCFYIIYKQKRVYCSSGIALRVTEDFTDRYKNVALSGLNYRMFGINPTEPFRVNKHIYSIFLIKNDLPNRWRGRHNEDTDLCLQVLADGWCTIQINAFLADKITTMTMKGGNEQLYKGDGRLKSTRHLIRQWPHIVELKRKFGRPHHHIKGNWTYFRTPLQKKSEEELNKLPKIDYKMELVEKKEIKSEYLKKIVNESKNKQCGAVILRKKKI